MKDSGKRGGILRSHSAAEPPRPITIAADYHVYSGVTQNWPVMANIKVMSPWKSRCRWLAVPVVVQYTLPALPFNQRFYLAILEDEHEGVSPPHYQSDSQR